MSKHIAVSGKGGTGKTTVAALLIKRLVEAKKGSVLAVDADPNATLNDALGVKVTATISQIIDEGKNFQGSSATSKSDYLKEKLHEAVITAEGYDLVVLGGPQGAGCYCIPMSMLKHNMESSDQGYDYMVIDNEAGMESLSRGIIPRADILLIISDPTVKGVRTAGRIYELAKSLNIDFDQAYLIITKIADPAALRSEIDATGLELLGVIPYDSTLADYDLRDQPLVELPPESPAVQATKVLFKKLGF